LQSKMVCLEYDVKLVNGKNERLSEENQTYKERLVNTVMVIQLFSFYCNKQKQ